MYIRSYEETVAPEMMIHPNGRGYFKNYTFTDTYNIYHPTNVVPDVSEGPALHRHAMELHGEKKRKTAKVLQEMDDHHAEFPLLSFGVYGT